MVFETKVSDIVRLKPDCTATKTRLNTDTFRVGKLNVDTSHKESYKTLIRLCGCAGWSRAVFVRIQQRHVF